MINSLINKIIQKIRRKSVWILPFNCSGCNGCTLELLATLGPRYDPERFGIKIVSTPRHADVLLVTGMVNKKMKKSLKMIYEQIPEPKLVVAVGNCTLTGCVFHNSYNKAGPVEKIIPVTTKISGCPPRPEALLDGIIKTIEKI